MNRMNINISGIVKELFERNNIQVHSLDALDKNLRNQFARKEKKATLLFRSDVLQAFIAETENSRLLLPLEALPISSKPGERILVILPSDRNNKRYVLQTFIKNVFIDRIELQVMDPRYYRRIRPSTECSILFRNVPHHLLLELQTEKLQLVRELHGMTTDHGPTEQEKVLPPEEGKAMGEETTGEEAPGDPAPGRGVTDLLFDEKGKIATGYAALLQDSPLSGTLIDFSCGGMRMTTENGDGAELLNDLLYCHLDLLHKDAAGNTAGLEINVFAAIRSIKASKTGHTLHLMFLGRLPDTVLSCMA